MDSGLFFSIYENVDKDKLVKFDQFLKKFGVYFNLYKDGQFIESIFPFDIIPRMIHEREFSKIERGVVQRITALNAFLNDIYGKQQIIKDGIIPATFIFSSKAYNPQLHGCEPNKAVRTHICGIDFVQEQKSDEWIILEDNLRVPSGASYPLSIREVYRKIYPEFFEQLNISAIIKPYIKNLREMFEYASHDGISVLLTPGRYNSAFYEHSYLAGELGIPMVTNDDLEVAKEHLQFKNYDGTRVKVGALYSRIGEEFLDPIEFNATSTIGVPNIINVYRKRNISLINAPGNGIADDKGVYYFVPQMIKYYLGEEPILNNAPTYLPYFEKDLAHVLANANKLVIKDVAEAGGYGVVFGSKLSSSELESLKESIKAEPRRFIAQEVVEFKDEDCFLDGKIVRRKADLRVFALHKKDIFVMPGGLTRYSTIEGNYIVNSSQGGGFKDTWVISDAKNENRV